MSFFNVLSLFGGLAMFLYGMRLMGDSLKASASGTLKVAMEHVTNNPVKAFILGLLMTAIIQSSTATIVITSGLVAAGILSLHQSLGIIVGANVGTTVTGQIIRLLDLDASGGTSWIKIFQPSSLAPIALIVGMVLIMTGKLKNSQSMGNILIGFGVLFSGLLNMTSAVTSLTESELVANLFLGLGDNPFLGYLTGAGVAFVLQSSSATIGILQAFSLAGLLPFKAVYAVIVGVYLGDCVTTAIVCSIGAKTDSRRVGLVNIIYNLSKSVLVLAGVILAHSFGWLDGIWDQAATPGIIANANTIFNLACAVILLPTLNVYEKLSRRIIPDEETEFDKYRDKVEALNPVFFNTPALALRSCYDLLLTIYRSSRTNIDKALSLLDHFDPKVYDQIQQEEEQIDQVTDRVSRYIVELLPYLREEYHIAILDQYYKVTAEFERLGDHAVNISDIAQSISQSESSFSEAAVSDLSVIREIIKNILDYADHTFEKRNIEAAEHIEPLVQVTEEIVIQMRKNHLKRMSKGQCSVYADASFENLLVELQRIAAVCSNIGIATVVRVRPELADHEHTYYASLHSGQDEKYNDYFNTAHDYYFPRVKKGKKNKKLAQENA